MDGGASHASSRNEDSTATRIASVSGPKPKKIFASGRHVSDVKRRHDATLAPRAAALQEKRCSGGVFSRIELAVERCEEAESLRSAWASRLPFGASRP